MTRFRVLGVALLANSAAIRAQIRVNTTHRIHAEESDQHGTDDGSSAHSGETGAQAGSHAGEKGDKNCD